MVLELQLVHVHLTKEQHRDLKAYAKSMDLRNVQIIRKALTEFLEKGRKAKRSVKWYKKIR